MHQYTMIITKTADDLKTITDESQTTTDKSRTTTDEPQTTTKYYC